jgi:acetylglutamate kinase
VEITEMALSGRINKWLSSELSSYGIKSLGISGRDSNLLKASGKRTADNGIEIDTGYMGEIKGFNKKLIMDLLSVGIVPVISPVANDANGKPYILEPDYAAHYISSALNAEKLIILNGNFESSSDAFFNRYDKDTEEDLDCLCSKRYNLKPEIDFAVKAISEGIREVYIIEGGDIENMLSNLFSDGNKKVMA